MSPIELSARRRLRAEAALSLYDLGEHTLVSGVGSWVQEDAGAHWYCTLSLDALEDDGVSGPATLHVRFAGANSAEVTDIYCLVRACGNTLGAPQGGVQAVNVR
jgi:hypothetical protein